MTYFVDNLEPILLRDLKIEIIHWRQYRGLINLDIPCSICRKIVSLQKLNRNRDGYV